MDENPKGKLFFAANPWSIAALAKKEGLRTDQFRESDMVPDGMMYVVDLDEVFKVVEDPFTEAREDDG